MTKRPLKLVETRIAAWVGLGASLLALATFGYAVRATIADVAGPILAARWFVAAVAAALAVTSVVLWLRLRTRLAVVRTNPDLRKELLAIITEAEQKLYCVGSRSRDHEHLDAIYDKVSANPNVEHVRVLCGSPRHKVFKEHIGRMVGIDAQTPDGRPRVRIAMFDDLASEPEQFVCANERRALIVCMPLGTFGRYDSAVLVVHKPDVECVLNYTEVLLDSGTRIKSADDAAALALTAP